MFLSLFLSFVLARKFKGIIYVPLMIVVIVLVSLFSMGLPTSTYSPYYHPAYDLGPLTPLSFPFYASIYDIWVGHQPDYYYRLNFLTFQINEAFAPVPFGTVCLHYSFFLLGNVVGAIVGYWVYKSRFLERLYKKSLYQKEIFFYFCHSLLIE